jgi:ornithine cyclodeaminase/alanine dehydrogenase-like protein (mu-crystallin family)
MHERKPLKNPLGKRPIITAMTIRVLTQADVEKLLPMDECIEVMSGAMAALARGQVFQPMRLMLRPPTARGIMAVMPAYLATSEQNACYGLKAICVFRGNPAQGKDAHQGAVLLYSGETGELLAVMNASAITAIRTAAMSGLATRLLARQDAHDCAIIGAGVQARSHLAAMRSVRALRRVRVASRTLAHAQKFAEECGPGLPFPIEAVATVEAAVRGADLIVTATTAGEPILRREWIAPGAHLNVVGAYTPTTREVDSATMAAARLFVDKRESALIEAGDVLLAMQAGAIGPEHIRAEIGEVVIGRQPGRASPDEITLFKSLGLPVEDVAAAEHLYRRALETGLGSTVPF